LENPETYTYQTGTNKLTHIETTPPIDFAYFDNANITSETGWTYIYDLSNQLIRVLQGSTQVAEYTYNGAGQRIKKVAGGVTTIFHHDLRGHLIAETNQSGQMLAEYVYLGDQLLAMIKPGENVYYFHNDHLGTPQVLTDDTGAVAWKAVYTPFGEAVPSIQTVENPFRFPGQYYDQETGLHYNYFRYYNPQTGRYITPDPIGLEGGVNLFAYVQNNPMNRVDPSGLWTISFGTTLMGAMGLGGWGGTFFNFGHDPSSDLSSGWSFSITGTVGGGVVAGIGGGLGVAVSGSPNARNVQQLLGTFYEGGTGFGRTGIGYFQSPDGCIKGGTLGMRIRGKMYGGSYVGGSTTSAIFQWVQGQGFSFLQ
jgi:RHS repeat-associated protein